MTILVVDEIGNAIPDAGIWCDPDRRRVLRRIDSAYVTKTSPDGRASLPAPSAAILAVGKHGFATALVNLGPEVTDHQVVLRRMHSQAFECVDTEGKPVVGARVAVCAMAFPVAVELGAEVEGEAAPGWDQRASLHTGVSDERGQVVLGGLAAGTFHCEASHPTHALIDGPGLSAATPTPLTCPGPPVRLRFAPFAVVAYRVVNDRLLWSRGKPSAGWSIGALWGRPETRLAASLRRHYPDARISVRAAAVPSSLVLRSELLLARAGRVEHALTYRPLPEVLEGGPESFDAGGLPMATTAAGCFRVEIVNADGGVLPNVPLTLHCDQYFCDFCSGNLAYAPVGEHRVTAVEPSVNNSLSTPCVVAVAAVSDSGAEPSPVRIQLQRQLHPVRLRKVTLPPEWSLPGGSLTLRFANGATRQQELGDAESVDVLLTPGPVQVELNGTDVRASFVVGGPVTDLIHVVDLVVDLR